MDSDCLNADKPDMFLAMKNKLKIMIKDSPRKATASSASDTKYNDLANQEINFSEQLREAFSQDLISQKPQAKNFNTMQVPEKPNGIINGAPNQFANPKK